METRRDDSFMNDAACEALGALTPAESTEYTQRLAAGGPEARAVDGQLRQTVALLAAASPHMAPNADLRGRVLQATAPATFRMEDYRKAVRDNVRFYKWGFVAAAVFLMVAAWFNIAVQNQLDRANATIAGLTQKGQERQDVITAFLNPNGRMIIWQDENKQPFARAIFDVHTRKAVVILPQEMLKAGYLPQLVLPINGQELAFQTVVVSAPARDLNLTVPTGADTAGMFNVQTLQTDDTRAPSIAGYR